MRRKWSGAQLPSKALLQVQGQPRTSEPTGATVWTGSPAPCWKGLLGGCRHFPSTLELTACRGLVLRGLRGRGPTVGEPPPSWSGGGRPWRELAASHADKALSGGKPNHLFSLSVLWSWKENPVYLPRFTKTLRSRDAHKVCTELKLPSFNSLIRLFIQQVSVKYPP